MVDIEWPLLLIQAISFIITLLLLKKLAWAPLLNMLASREGQIRGDYEKAEAERHKMEDLRRQYEQRIEGAEVEARNRITAAMQSAEAQANDITAQARQEAAATLERARAEMDRERQKVLAELRSQVSHLSVAIAGKIIDEHLDENKHRALVDDFIGRLGALS